MFLFGVSKFLYKKADKYIFILELLKSSQDLFVIFSLKLKN